MRSSGNKTAAQRYTPVVVHIDHEQPDADLADAKLLSYGDVLLRHGDLESLDEQEWINDQIIHFYFEYLSQEKYVAQADAVSLVPASMTYLFANSGTELTAAMLPGASHKALLVLAINDNAATDHAGGGSHWSLLVWHQPSATFRHYDSMHGANRGPAERVIRSLRPALGAAARSADVVQVAMMPRQENGYDCGVYVLALADALCRWQAEGTDLLEQEAALATWLTPSRMLQQRRDVLQLIQAKVAQQQQ